ncbi:hypothetical protein [Nocardioides ungokensis]|uniref:hypothetical protein n=1 Tax=Nocardioides ungokensis TaxID=1643322 RepID=UPI0015DDA9B4|nr:hypothetical protein [Nocardioides ungokensis]
MFATRARRPADDPGARGELSEEQRQALPPLFEAVGEALASGGGVEAPCEAVGRLLAARGTSLDEALEALARTARAVTGRDPDHAAARAVAVAWSDATLTYLHRLACDDPLTGLASMPHLRGRLADLYRGDWDLAVGDLAVGDLGGRRSTRDGHALVMIEAPSLRGEGDAPSRTDDLTGSLLLGQLGATARLVFAGSETIGRVGATRVAVLARRDRLGPRVAVLTRMLEELGPPVRVWIEGLPGTDGAAAALLDELARG